MYANKKVNQKGNLAQQTAQIIANVMSLEEKNLINLTDDTVYLHPTLWKDKLSASNWINCLHRYYVVKRKVKPSAPLYFKAIDTLELIGSIIEKKPKVLLFK